MVEYILVCLLYSTNVYVDFYSTRCTTISTQSCRSWRECKDRQLWVEIGCASTRARKHQCAYYRDM